MIIKNYNCTDIKYPNEKELKVKDNLKLKNDKAGIVEIMAMLEVVKKYFIRDFYEDGFQKRKDILKEIADKLNEKYNNCITLDIKDSYYNMLNIIKKEIIVVDIVKKSMEEIGITPIVKPIRGGTDGVRISYMGIPCPNIGTGSHNFHGVYEYTSLENMEKTCDILVNIVKNVSNIDNKIKVKK